MKIILKENIENLGNKGDIIDVAAGFGRNYLLPKKLALEVTSSNMKMIEMEQAALKKNLEKARESYQDTIQKISDLSFSFKRKAGEKDTIFGSVSVTDIKEKLEKLGFEIEKKKILLKEPIKRLGNYTVPIKVFLDDIAEIKVQVVPEGTEEEYVKPVDSQAKEVPKEKKAVDKTEGKKDEETAEMKEEPKEESMPVESKAETETDNSEEEKDLVVVEEKTAEEEPSEETPEVKELEDTATPEDKEAVQSEIPPPAVEEKPEPEPEAEIKEGDTEETAVDAPSPKETGKNEEKEENNEKSKTSQ